MFDFRAFRNLLDIDVFVFLHRQQLAQLRVEYEQIMTEHTKQLNFVHQKSQKVCFLFFLSSIRLVGATQKQFLMRIRFFF
jgi:hypothetical protein